MTKQDEAIRKLTEECNKEPWLVPFEEYLTSICTTPEIAEKILEEGKTLEKAAKGVMEAARKRAVKGAAMLADDEVYTMLRNYFGIELKEKRRETDFIDIDDFL